MCDTLAATPDSTATGATLFGKNSDRDYREAQYLELIPRRRHDADAQVQLTYVAITQVRETHQVLISKPHWIWGAEMGVNEHGLAIGNEAVFSTVEASSEPGVIGMDYVRLALERARTVEEGVGVITSLLACHGQSGNCGFSRSLTYQNSFLLADTRGAAVLETVNRDWVVRSIDGRDAISNAFTTEAEFQAASAGASGRGSFRKNFEDAGRSASGFYRRARALALLAAKGSGLVAADLFEILSDHVEGPPVNGPSGPRICMHRRENPIGQTTASWVSDLRPKRQLHWVTGTAAACTGLFKPVCLETGLPEHGARPGGEPDEASLWWRHESLRAALETADPEGVRRFNEERGAMQADFLEGMADFATLEPAVLASRIDACWRAGLSFEQTWLARLSTA